jgi:vancomycin permeability regulator SanA
MPWRRGVAAFLGAVALLDVVRAIASPGLRAGSWWLSLSPLSNGEACAAMLPLSVAFGSIAAGKAWRWASALLVAAGLGAGLDAVGYWWLLSAGAIAGSLVPLSALTCGVLVWLAFARVSSRIRAPSLAVATAAAGVVFTLAQMVLYGSTDYRRSADVVVVLGARVYADGTPSLALADRVRTGCALVREGRAARLVLSGGPGDGAIHETETMARLARDCGVPADAIVIDRDGLDTSHTAHNLAVLAPGARVIAVSHGYHLPRVKLALEQAGLRGFTVPARESRTLVKLPYFMAREVVAFWSYYVAPLGLWPLSRT